MNLYHYCSNAVLTSILSNREIWASELALSNDALEGKWLRRVFVDCCNEKGVTPSDQVELLNYLDLVISMAGYAGFCMSEEGDLLSQWRAYADNGMGASVGFNSEYFEVLGNIRRDRGDTFSAHLTEVIYDSAEQKKLLAEHVDEIIKLIRDGALRQSTFLTSEEDNKKRKDKLRTMGLRFLFFYFFVFKLKNPAFSEEREWRVISHIVQTERDVTLGQLAKMEFKAHMDRIVPFARILLEPLPHSSITEIVLGPRNATPERVVEAFLLKNGWSNVSVNRSLASYR
jgi:hypothetical protein